MKRRLFSIILSVCMVITLLPVSAKADEVDIQLGVTSTDFALTDSEDHSKVYGLSTPEMGELADITTVNDFTSLQNAP